MLPRFAFSSAVVLTLALGFAPRLAASASADSLGLFGGRTDVGAVSRLMQVTHDANTGTYTIGASGANMWGAADEFGFVWKKVSGDIAIAAEIAFVGDSAQGHRKACLMIRQSLEPDSAYADVAVHGNGLTSLQFRRERGGPTREVQAPLKAPARVRLEKRGAYVFLSTANESGEWTPTGCVTRLTFDGAFYVGLAVCAHDNAAFETAKFSAVEVGALERKPATRTTALEVIPLASLDRRVVFRTSGKAEAPHFSPNGDELFFNHEGRIKRVKLHRDFPARSVAAAGEPVVIDTGFAVRCINDHGISPDGRQLVISDLTESGKSRMYLLPIEGGTPKRVDVAEPALWHGWSPDGKTLTYCAQRDGNYDVYTVPVAGGPEKRLTTEPGNDNGPDYSADGKWIYYHSIRDARVQVWRMSPTGEGKEQVTDDEYYNWFPHPSPDGKWIAVLSTKVVPDTGHPPDGDYVLRLLPTGGGAPREIAHFFAGNGSFNVPSWSADSAFLAYATYSP